MQRAGQRSRAPWPLALPSLARRRTSPPLPKQLPVPLLESRPLAVGHLGLDRAVRPPAHPAVRAVRPVAARPPPARLRRPAPANQLNPAPGTNRLRLVRQRMTAPGANPAPVTHPRHQLTLRLPIQPIREASRPTRLNPTLTPHPRALLRPVQETRPRRRREPARRRLPKGPTLLLRILIQMVAAIRAHVPAIQ